MTTFPVLSTWQWKKNLPDPLVDAVPRSIPWSIIEACEARAQKNHGQTLKRLAERGGLSLAELYCVVHDKPYYQVDDCMENTISEYDAALWLKTVKVESLDNPAMRKTPRDLVLSKDCDVF